MLFLTCMVGLAQDKIYVHTATAENSSGNVTYIDNPDLNNDPNAAVVYTHSWNPSGLSPVYNNNVTGLWYSSGAGKWAIYNEDASTIVPGSHYMIYIASNPANVITQISNAGNAGSFGNYTTAVDNVLLNNLNPGPYAVMCHYYNPNAVYNTQNFGFYYDTALNKRGIFDEDATPAIPDGAAFRILVNGEASARFTHQSLVSNTSGNVTTIDNAALNGNPNATFVFSHYWGVNGSDTEVNLNAVTSSYYDGSRWNIYLEDTTLSMPINAAFDIIVAPVEVLNVQDIQNMASIKMYPNPAQNNVQFTATENIEKISIFNILGQEVLSSVVGNTSKDLDISQLTTGTYLAKIETATGIQTIKLLKQ